MANTSATGGYLTPTSSEALPGSLTLTQFIQSVIVGISGYPGTTVRPKWQVAPPKQPLIETDWIAFGVQALNPDTNAFVWMDNVEVTHIKRMTKIAVQCAFYGPNAMDNIQIFLDGFQIQQNLEAMRAANMNYQSFDPPVRVPDLVNERWVERLEATVYLTRQIQRVYPILSFASASGIIHTVASGEELNIDWETGEVT